MTAITAGSELVPANIVDELLDRVIRRVSRPFLESEIGHEILVALEDSRSPVPADRLWPVLRFVYRHRLFELLPINDIPSFSYDVLSPFDLTGDPIGFGLYFPVKPLLKKPTKIGGHRVDFPLGLPASVLAANSKWIEFYSNRGFDILTYKTVRSVFREAHTFPNWAFLEGADQLNGASPGPVTGEIGSFPEGPNRVSMANSFGIPSFEPAWWQDDIRRARKSVRPGHQVLIVSVVASDNSDISRMQEDFVKTARLAVDAGADIIEANYSCPNTPDDPAGLVYKSPDTSRKISAALKEALGRVPLFVKIGYLSKDELRGFIESNVDYIDGVTAINTLSTTVLDRQGRQLFPGEGRQTAGVSGWAIQTAAMEVCRNLLLLRSEMRSQRNRDFQILGVGGVLGRDDFNRFLNLGVDAVETATGAFFNPFIGLDIRIDEEKQRQKPSYLSYAANVVARFFDEVLLHPNRRTYVKVDPEERRVTSWFPEGR